MTRTATLVSAALLLMLAAAPSAHSQAPLPFRDDFSANNILDGNPVSWSSGGPDSAAMHFASDGDYHIKSSGGGIAYALVDGSQGFRNGSMHAVVRVNQLNPNDFYYVGLVGRGTSSSDGFYYGGIFHDVGASSNLITAGRWNPYLDNGGPPTTVNPATMDVDLQLDFRDDTISIWAWSDAAGIPKPILPQDTLQDTTFSSGQIGFVFNSETNGSELIVRSFEFVPEPAAGTLLLVGAIVCGLLHRLRARWHTLE
jgi:hypothetical protein